MKLLTFLTASIVAMGLSAQDLHFSQVLQSPALVNPGAVGVYDGWERVEIHHRNQWLGANTQFMSSSIEVDAVINKDRQSGKAYMGVGLMFFNDIGGDARFGTQTGSLTLSGVLPMAGGSQLSVGVQGGFGKRKGDMSKLVYGNQWNGSTLDPSVPSGEGDELNSFSYLDASTGVFYQYDGNKSTFSRNNDVKFQTGLAIYHVNGPVLKYYTGSGERLFAKYAGMANLVMDLPSRPVKLELSFVQFIQGGHYETIFGGIVHKRFREGSKQTGFNQDATFGFGAYARLKDAIIPTFQLNIHGFRIGVSYDMPLSIMRTAYGGSIEVFLSWTNMQHALFSTRRGQR